MIRSVPSPRLLSLAAWIGLPLLTIAGLAPRWTFYLLAVLAAVLLCALWDLRRGAKNIRDLDVTLPKRINLFLGRPTEFEVRLANRAKRKRFVRVGLNFPREVRTESEIIDVSLPDDSEHSNLSWKCEATRRGSLQIPSAHLEIESPARLWNVRSSRAAETEVRVYPDLLTERKNVAAVFLSRGAYGARARRQIGKGRDFEKLRDYFPGDPMEDVHWKASAKRGRLISKVFQIERTQEVYVAVDCSRLSNRQSAGNDRNVTMLDRFITSALLLGLAAEKQGDHFGLITFSDQVHSLIRARNGKAHFALCRDALFNLQPRLVTPNYDEFFSTVRLRLRKRALLLVLTALDDPLLAETFAKSVELVNRKHLLLVAMIEPGRVEPMFKHPVNTEAELYGALGGHVIWQKLRQVEKMLAWRSVRFSALPNELFAAEVINQYLRVKQRQIL